MRGNIAIIFGGICVVMLALIAVVIFGIGSNQTFGLVNIRQGLDLQGGVSILYEADTPSPSSENMDAANALLRNRLDSRGYTEATTMQEGARQIRVDIPGVEDAEAAVTQIGATAMLMFVDERGLCEMIPALTPDEMNWHFCPPDCEIDHALLTGAHVSNAFSVMQPNMAGIPERVVSLEFNREGTQLFADATRANLGPHSYFNGWL